MLKKIHGSDLAMEKCFSGAREGLFWPNISRSIYEEVASCGVYNNYVQELSSQGAHATSSIS